MDEAGEIVFDPHSEDSANARRDAFRLIAARAGPSDSVFPDQVREVAAGLFARTGRIETEADLAKLAGEVIYLVEALTTIAALAVETLTRSEDMDRADVLRGIEVALDRKRESGDDA